MGGKVIERGRTEFRSNSNILKCLKTNRSNEPSTHPVRKKPINPNVHGSNARETITQLINQLIISNGTNAFIGASGRNGSKEYGGSNWWNRVQGLGGYCQWLFP